MAGHGGFSRIGHFCGDGEFPLRGQDCERAGLRLVRCRQEIGYAAGLLRLSNRRVCRVKLGEGPGWGGDELFALAMDFGGRRSGLGKSVLAPREKVGVSWVLVQVSGKEQGGV